MKERIMLFLLACLLFSAAQAKQPYVPDDLKDWQQWVLHGDEFRSCPRFFNRADGREAFVCAWAEPLQLLVNARGGRFDLRVQTYAETWVQLPGDLENFPQEVTLNNSPALVAENSGKPALYLPAGSHAISGRFSWTRRPETLRLPDELALLSLNVDGKVITDPERRGEMLWLGERQQRSEQPESLEIEVYRLLVDDIPMRLVTNVRLRVAGGAREVLLGRALPAGFVPMALSSAVPARLEPDGQLRLQIRPGSFELSLTARAQGVPDRVALEAPGGPWAKTEIWSYQDNPRLRVTNATSASPVDPAQVDVPGPWRAYPAFSLSPGQALNIEERGRGISADRSNQLNLNRTLWLDFDGKALTAQDQLSGEMRNMWRLDMAEPYALLSARSGEDELLVTGGSSAGLSGVELRSPVLNLETISRVAAGGAIPASGWTDSLTSMQATLNLPPGYMLLATLGVDRSPGAWVAYWQLLDFFLLLVIAVAVRRLFGNLAGLVALAALMFSFHEPGAPIWSWLNLVVALALARTVTKGLFGRLAATWRNLSFLALLVVLLPFVASQARLALFPQLEAQTPSIDAVYSDVAAPALDMSRPAARLEKRSAEITLGSPEAVLVTGSRPASGAFSERYDPDALVQTGPGLASWQWRSVFLQWNGPVEPGQTVNLLMLSPWQTALWRVVGAAFCAALFYLLLRGSLDLSAPLRRLREGSAVAAGFLVIAILPWPGDLRAETPPQPVLDELKARLIAAPECVPVCATAPSARVDASVNELAIELDIHASVAVAVPLPGQANGWQPSAFSVDGRRRALLYRDPAGSLWLDLDAGIHTVRLIGPMPANDTFQVSFPMLPREVLASAIGWELTGVREQRLVSGAIELSRIKQKTAGALDSNEPLTADRFPMFVEVTRYITLGLDWSVRTLVQRVAPDAGVINVEIPLLPGESVITANVPVRGGSVVVAMAPGAQAFAWESSLQKAQQLTLSVPESAPWSETWQVAAGYIWHASYMGTPMILPANFPGDFWVPEFHPRSGESMTMDIERPQAVAGETLAIDRVDYIHDVGDRNSTFTLNLSYRSTRGQQHAIELPSGAELEDIQIDGQKQQLRLEDNRLVLPITPGRHAAAITFKLAEGVRAWQRLPGINLNAASSNLTAGFNLPDNRWVLATRGPTLGPAVLYWAELVVFLVLAWLLGKTTLTPLKTHDWLLLGLGFSTFSWGVLMLVAGWLFVMGWRARSTEFGAPIWFNLRQLLLALASIGVILSLVYAIPMALLGNPDMHVIGNGSSMHSLRWFDDRSLGGTPVVAAMSVPMWAYKLLILLWSLWLSFALVRWLPWAWQALRSGGSWAELDIRGKRPKVPETGQSGDSG